MALEHKNTGLWSMSRYSHKFHGHFQEFSNLTSENAKIKIQILDLIYEIQSPIILWIMLIYLHQRYNTMFASGQCYSILGLPKKQAQIWIPVSSSNNHALFLKTSVVDFTKHLATCESFIDRAWELRRIMHCKSSCDASQHSVKSTTVLEMKSARYLIIFFRYHKIKQRFVAAHDRGIKVQEL
jgi:hypothetical protein